MIRYNDKWKVINIPDQSQVLLVGCYWFILSFFYVLIIVLWKIKSKSRREKKQASILLVSFFLPGFFLVSYFVFFFNFFKFTKDAVTGEGTLIFFIWILGIGYCILKYRFLSITPEYISGELISNIDELVILITPDRKVITMNERAKELIGDKTVSDITDFSKIIPEYESIGHKVNKLFEGRENSFNCRISYPGNNQKMYMNARFSAVKDRFNDILGILIIAKENKELKHLKISYNLTERQMDIITMVLSGLSNKELAGKLLISERTVENHLVNIYNKLGINNKIELYNMLQEYENEKFTYYRGSAP